MFNLRKKNVIVSFALSLQNLTPAQTPPHTHTQSLNVTLYRLLTPGLITDLILPQLCLLSPNKPL